MNTLFIQKTLKKAIHDFACTQKLEEISTNIISVHVLQFLKAKNTAAE